MAELTTSRLRALHLAENPNDDYLLRQELDDQGFDAQVELVSDRATLLRRVEDGAADVLIVDLPLVEDVTAEVFDDLAQRHPQLPVVYRWGDCGQRIAEPPSEQLGRRLREALDMRLDRPQDGALRARLIDELVRHQRVHLDLVRQDLWDTDAALRRITEAMAALLRVERVSVWELTPGDRALRCLDLFVATDSSHTVAPPIDSFPEYLASLQRSLTLAAPDALADPRTSELHGYLRPPGIRAMLDAPVRRNGRVVGVLCHEHTGPEPRNWSLLEQCAAAKSAGIVGRAFEVRDRRRSEETAARLQRLEATGLVAKGVAHDMNNLLTALGGSLELARGDGPGRDAALDSARAAAQGLAALVKDLAAIGQNETLHRARLDLRAWLSGQADLLRAMVPSPAVLEVDHGDQELVVRADAAALARVLVNLVRNAAESLRTPDGRITVRLGRRASAGDGADRAELQVVDDGIGMSAYTLQQLFQPYFSRHGGEGGRGLGLATSLGLVRQHGGTIDVDSQPGRGSRLSVLLPLAGADRPLAR
ncbi:MAG: ATP-binding protein [Planctomycetota bacterium]